MNHWMTCLQRVIFRGTKKPMKIRGDAKYVLGFNKNVGNIITALCFGYENEDWDVHKNL